MTHGLILWPQLKGPRYRRSRSLVAIVYDASLVLVVVVLLLSRGVSRGGVVIRWQRTAATAPLGAVRLAVSK